jgi:dTDP-4-amino-4,6-dideoxygalactose transaminase
LDEIQAAVLRIKLRYLQKNNEHRAKLAKIYNSLIKPTDDLILPITAPWALHAWHLYVIRHKSRGDLMGRLEAAGIETMIHYPIPPSSQEAYKSQFDNKLMTTAFFLSNQVLSLPLNTSLTEEDVSYISRVINT